MGSRHRTQTLALKCIVVCRLYEHAIRGAVVGHTADAGPLDLHSLGKSKAKLCDKDPDRPRKLDPILIEYINALEQTKNNYQVQ